MENSIIFNNHQHSSSRNDINDNLSKSSEKTFSSIEALWNLTASEDDGELENDGHKASLEEVAKEIDGLIDELSYNSALPDIPRVVLTFSKMIKSVIEKYESPESTLRFGQNEYDDITLINALRRISNLSNLFNKFSSDEKVMPFLSITTLVIRRAMTYMEEELRIILQDSNLKEERREDLEENYYYYYPMINEEEILKMKKIASLMISMGYETQCCQVYNILRQNALKEAILQHGFENISMDEVQKMQWEILEGHIGNWIKVSKFISSILLPREKKLCIVIFSDENTSIGEAIFSNLARSIIPLSLSFAEAISMVQQTQDRFFKMLDVYDALTKLITTVDQMHIKDCAEEVMPKLYSVRQRLGEAVVWSFYELENELKTDVSKTSPPGGGGVHPTTRNTMDYLRYGCDYKDTLEQVLYLHHDNEQTLKALEPWKEHQHCENKNQGPKQTPFTAEILTIMNLLDEYLEAKSRLYKDPSLRCIFLMNNGRYILQKIKESTELYDLLGSDYRRKRSSDLREYHKNYQRETWSRVLQCLNQEGLQLNGKVPKSMLKERFKTFNHMLDEIHKTQSHWVVSDEQLQSELQVSISAVIIPAYRSFVTRFGQQFSSKRKYDKYIKYQPEDIEKTIHKLFNGNQNLSMSKRKN